jgi:ferredoxin-NADP reductase
MQIVTLHVTTRSSDAHGGHAVHFTPDRPIRFTAGQHAFWRIPGGGIHPFTIASAPEEQTITLGTSLASQSPLKRVIAALTESDPVRLLGPLANFTLDPTNPAVVMLAQGVGVTPYRSMLRHLSLAGRTMDTTLLHVGAEHPFRDDTESLARTSHYVTSREEYAERLAEVVDRRPQASYLVSGSREFVGSTAAALRAAGIRRGQLRRDTFYGYQDSSPAPAQRAAR